MSFAGVTVRRRGRPARLRPVDRPIDEYDQDAASLLDVDMVDDRDLQRLAVETTSGVYASRRAE